MCSRYLFSRLGQLSFAVKNMPVGSDASAAGGRISELSEWQRSAKRKPALTGEAAAGHRNRGIIKPPVNQGMLAPGKHSH